MPKFIIDSVDFEYTMGGVPVSGKIEARLFAPDTVLEISANISPDALSAIHQIVIDELNNRWQGVPSNTKHTYEATIAVMNSIFNGMA